jgi:hypothetical protein
VEPAFRGQEARQAGFLGNKQFRENVPLCRIALALEQIAIVLDVARKSLYARKSPGG